MPAITICSDIGAQKNKVSHCFHCFPIYLPWSDGIGWMILVFWMLNFKPTFSLSSFTFIKKLFSSSLLSAIRVVSSAYLRLLIFLLAILIPACASSSSMFLMMYSAYKLNKQDYNIHPWHTPFPTWNQSVPCPVLTVASWPACRFLLDILFTRYAKWNSAYPVVYWKAFDGWDELFLESSHVLCFANETSTMVNNWYSILYSLANGLKPEATGHEHPTKNIILRSITWGSLSCTSFFLTSKTRCYATTFWIILFPELLGEKKKKPVSKIQTLSAPVNDSS